MSDEGWLKTLLEKMDQDRRDAERRLEASIARIEHLIERQMEQVDATRREISDQNRALNSRIDQAYQHFSGLSKQTTFAVWANVAAVIAIGVAVIIGLIQIYTSIKGS